MYKELVLGYSSGRARIKIQEPATVSEIQEAEKMVGYSFSEDLIMKKVIIGAAMLLSGVIGFVGWCIVCALTVEPGARSRVWGCLDGSEWVPVIVFAVLAVYGLVLALKNTKNESE